MPQVDRERPTVEARHVHEWNRFIQQQMDARGWRQADLVRASGLSRQHVSNMLRDTREHLGQMPDDDTIAAISTGFGLPDEAVRRVASHALAGIGEGHEPVRVGLGDVSIDELLEEIRRRVVANATAEGRLIMHTRVGPVPFDEPTPENVAIRERLTEQRQALEAGDQAPHRSSQH